MEVRQRIEIPFAGWYDINHVSGKGNLLLCKKPHPLRRNYFITAFAMYFLALNTLPYLGKMRISIKM
jgi:hypothetical protein